MARLGIIGGSGLYQIEGITNIKKVHVETPFGDPSDAFIIGNFAGREVVFLPRHALSLKRTSPWTVLPHQAYFEACPCLRHGSCR